jgi:MerE protein
MRKNFALVGAVVTCPCHLPLWIVLLGGTTAGVFLVQHRGAVLLFTSIFFVLFAGLVVRAEFGPRTCRATAEPSSESGGFGKRRRSREKPSASPYDPVL